MVGAVFCWRINSSKFFILEYSILWRQQTTSLRPRNSSIALTTTVEDQSEVSDEIMFSRYRGPDLDGCVIINPIRLINWGEVQEGVS